ncbi:hypothetical protein CBL_09474 [Carabus blaptoides fortunei]
MNVVDIHSTVKTSLSCFTKKYSGETDSYKFRNGKGIELWKQKNRQQIYTGSFLQDSLHGLGTYKWIIDNVSHTYEGNIYANNLEGYGQLSYPDGKIYEGLFFLNRRYGPGVLTYPDGTQDVGLWDALKLIRLNQVLCANVVPQLANSSKGRTHLLQYKHLIPICEWSNPNLEYIINNEDIQDKNELFSKNVQNPNSTFFNHKLYYNLFFQNETDYTVDVVETMENDKTDTKKVIVTHLLAWNNEDLAKAIMKHSFRHRNSETLLSYHVSDVLTGRRQQFRSLGYHESLCLNLLESCCENNEQKIIKLICESDLYPDLADSVGNTGITYAASRDHVCVIETLVDFGANVDHLNDECLTPLLICILRCLALKNDVVDWEKAFLPLFESRNENPEIQEWRIRNHANINENKLTSIEKEQEYLLNLECIHPNIITNIGQKKPKKKQEAKTKKQSKINVESEKTDGEIDNLKNELLQKICKTIHILLQCGADPNFGEVPFPPLILSLFAKDECILSKLIQFDADPNITISSQNGHLTPLHIIASLTPSPELAPMVKILFTNGANPNPVANVNHWMKEKDILLAGTQTFDSGKTPLQLLCMRWDFEQDICDHLGELFTALVECGADVTSNYLGHTVLSLAIIRGNTRLIIRILESGLVDPNESLGNKMGVPLTVLILKRYENILPLNTCEKVYNILTQYHANPLNNVLEFNGNTVEFAIKENTLEVVEESSKKNNKKKKSKGTSKKSTGNEKVILILKDCASKTLDKHLQGKAVKLIYDYKIQCEIDDDIFNEIAKFINLEDTHKEMLESEPGYFENLELRYSFEERFGSGRMSRKDIFEERSKKRKKSKQKSSEVSGRTRSKSEKKDRSHSKVREKSEGRKRKAGSKLNSAKNKRSVSKKKKDKQKSQSTDRDKSKGKKKSSRSKDREKSKDTEKKGRSKSRSKNRVKDGSRYKKADKEKVERKYRERSRKDKLSKEKRSTKERSKSRAKMHKDGKLKGTKVRFDERSKSRNRSGRNEKSRTEKMTEGMKSRSRSREASKSRYHLEERRLELVRKLREGIISDEYLDMISDICEFNPRFFEMFMPYCVFIDGQLYYKFDGSNAFCKLTYSNV